MTLTVTDENLTAISVAIAVFVVGQFETVVQRIEELERRRGIQPDTRPQISVGALAEQLRDAMATALASQ